MTGCGDDPTPLGHHLNACSQCDAILSAISSVSPEKLAGVLTLYPHALPLHVHGHVSRGPIVPGGWARAESCAAQLRAAGETHPLASIVYGDSGIDDPIGLRVGTPSPSGGPTAFADYFYILDDQSSVTALVDTLGNVTERYDYQECGTPMFLDPCLNLAENASGPATRSLLSNPLLFQGQVYDDETGLYEFRTRYMDPAMGRFTSRDRIGTWGGPSNLGNGLGFAAASPQIWSDPLGLKSDRRGREDPWLERDLRPDDFGTESGDWADDFYKWVMTS